MPRTNHRILCLLSLFVLVSGSPAVWGQTSFGSWLTDSRTAALAVDKIEEHPDRILADQYPVTIAVRNLSPRTVTAFAIDVPTPGRSPGYIELAGMNVMRPGETHDVTVSCKKDTEHRVHLIAVLFEDNGADEGDRAAIEHMRYMRLGKLGEEMRLLRIFKAANKAALNDATLEALIQSVGGDKSSLADVLPGLVEATRGTNLQIERRLAGANRDTIEAFLTGVSFRLAEYRAALEHAKGLPLRSLGGGRDRSSFFTSRMQVFERRAAQVLAVCERDKEVEQ